jgi:hypothetical protein
MNGRTAEKGNGNSDVRLPLIKDCVVIFQVQNLAESLNP